MRCRSVFVAFLTCICFLEGAPPGSGIAPEVRAALDRIDASSLRDNLKFIASDELQGRDSPSPGLDRAANYIADQFQRAGLEPGVNGGYFQDASMVVEEPDFSGFELKLSSKRRELAVPQKDVELNVPAGLDLEDAPLYKLDVASEDAARQWTADEVKGKVFILDPRPRGAFRRVVRMLRQAKPALLITVEESDAGPHGMPIQRLLDPADPPAETGLSRARIAGPAAKHFLESLKPGENGATVTVHIGAPHRTHATLRNVIGVLRGSDPALRDTYVLLTAHYDHLGVKPEGPGHRIYNGANDDGSGTVSVIEVARALAKLPRHPRRSIVFMTFFGEEEGLIGSDYYVHHPVWPLAKTVADLNLEQVGRTDSTLGTESSNATLTGFDYSGLTGFVQTAGKDTGITIYKNARASDDYFSASDNYSFAEAGVPAETLTVAFDYPDYHAVGDQWQKIDYGNMAKVDRAVALALFLTADSTQPVRWNDENPKTAPYVKALEKRETN